MTKANDQLAGYTGTEQWYRYHAGTLITEGTKAFAEKFHCYWLMDIIASYQPGLRKKEIDYQYWTIHKDGEGATVRCWQRPQTDNEKYLILEQRIPWTDFGPDWGEIWLKNDVMLLPSED